MTLKNKQNTEIEKLLSVLDLSEEKQRRRLVNPDYGLLDYKTQCDLASCRISLADLAFRMRDEWAKKIFSKRMLYEKALKIIWKYRSHEMMPKGGIKISYTYWLALKIQPIDRIIASRIAEQLAG